MHRSKFSSAQQAQCTLLCALCMCMHSAGVLQDQFKRRHHHHSTCMAPNPGAVHMQRKCQVPHRVDGIHLAERPGGLHALLLAPALARQVARIAAQEQRPRARCAPEHVRGAAVLLRHAAQDSSTAWIKLLYTCRSSTCGKLKRCARAAACLHVKVGFRQQVRVILVRVFLMGLRLALLLGRNLPLRQACTERLVGALASTGQYHASALKKRQCLQA